MTAFDSNSSATNCPASLAPAADLYLGFRPIDNRIFDKCSSTNFQLVSMLTFLGSNETYRYKAFWCSIDALPSLTPGWLDLFHFNSILLQVTARPFLASNRDHVLLWGKSTRGWQSVHTPAISLLECTDLRAYIQKCIPCCIDEYRDDKILDRCGVLAHSSSFVSSRARFPQLSLGSFDNKTAGITLSGFRAVDRKPTIDEGLAM